MRYESTITSKGTITIAAPLRKALGLKPGQKVHMSLDDNKVVVDPGMTMEQFEAIRDQIVSKIPKHKKGLNLRKMREMAAKNWLAKQK